MWTEPRVYAGKHGVVPKTGVGVGGGTLVWLGVMPRFHPEDFRTRSTEGVGADWPIGYDDLRPYYEQIEREFGVAGECGPFAPEAVRRCRMPPHRMNWHAQVLARGAREARRAAVRAAGRHQLGRLRRPARVHLLRLVRLGLPHRGEGHGVANTYLAPRRTRRRPGRSARRSSIA